MTQNITTLIPNVVRDAQKVVRIISPSNYAGSDFFECHPLCPGFPISKLQVTYRIILCNKVLYLVLELKIS